MNVFIKSILNKGALFLTPEHQHWLVFADYKEENQEIKVWFQSQSDPALQHKSWKINTWSFDHNTQKLYFAHTATAYLQIQPVPFDDIQTHRKILIQHYFELTNNTLPQIGENENWPVQSNHCFQRIILDRLFKKAWFYCLPSSKKPAYQQLSNTQLGYAITLARKIISEGKNLVDQWNFESLNYRNKI